MSEYKALVVDYGGVLTTPLQQAMAAFADELEIELQDLVRVALGAYAGGEDSLVTDFETGRITEDEFTTRFAARLAEVSGRPVESTDLVRRVFAGVELEEPMLAAVRQARAHGFKTALLSNSWGTSLYPIELFAELFDAVVISGEVGLRKPDPEIFRLAADKLGVEPADCVFVDDHPGHLKAAAELGMTTVLHRDPQSTIADLERLLDARLAS